jgi:hypothetical protein
MTAVPTGDTEAGDMLDDFRDLSGWSAVASGQAQLTITPADGPHGPAMRLDFDFHGGGGFVVARKLFARAMPPSWAIGFQVRGAAPANKLELKLADPSGRNVWWFHRDAFEFPADWQPLRIRSREVEFAWGPAGGGAMRELGAIEIAIAAGPGGKGSIWLADLRFEDLEPKSPPAVQASSALPGHAPASVLDGSSRTSWRSDAAPGPQWLLLDFHTEREYGGLVIDWQPRGGARAFEVRTSADGRDWHTAWTAQQTEGDRSYVSLPGGASRFLRLDLLESQGGGGFGIVGLGLRPNDFSRTPDTFFHSVALEQRRGLHPRWLVREQSYWTPIGVASGSPSALLNEEGLLEVDRGSFSLEPFLFADGELITWADAEIAQQLVEDSLPIPSSQWRAKGFVLTTTAFATDAPGGPVLYVRYRIENAGDAVRTARFFCALRPFQVTPPWQAFRGLGGACPIGELRWHAGTVWIDERKAVIPLEAPSGFGAAAFEQGGVLRFLERGEIPPRDEVRDAFLHASGALCFDLELAAGAARDFHLAVPFGMHDPANSDFAALQRIDGAAQFASATSAWRDKLGHLELRVGAAAQASVDALRTAASHILINRDGPALQPGPRRYTRSWIRDGATMSAALLRMGWADEVRDFLRWYAPHQKADGNVPCSVDREGPDWLPEHDSHGELVFLVAEHFRFTRDRALLDEFWPAVLRAVAYIESLRSQRLTSEFASGDRKACYGILPESVSHEGYLAQPVHAYWDDFWALRGLGDAVHLARVLGDAAQERRIAALRDDLQTCLYASIEAVIAQRDIAYVPGSVEWADFDVTATATALTTTDAAERLPPAALAYTYDEYLRGFRKRRDGELDWNNYTAYEIRNLGALVRLGRVAEAHELLDFFLADRRPRAWNQWPEISWRDPRSPGHLGDVPHTWIGAEWVLAVLSLFAYEHPTNESLVLAAGVRPEWIDGGAVIAIENLPTWYGRLSYTLARVGDDGLRLSLSSDFEMPPGGIVVRSPLPRPLARVTVDGRDVMNFEATSVRLDRRAVNITLQY